MPEKSAEDRPVLLGDACGKEPALPDEVEAPAGRVGVDDFPEALR